MPLDKGPAARRLAETLPPVFGKSAERTVGRQRFGLDLRDDILKTFRPGEHLVGMLDAFEGLLEGGNGRGHINVKADGAAVPVICRAGESVLRLNDLCAVEDFSVGFCGELLLNQEGQLNNVSIGFGLVLGPVADGVLARIFEYEV